MSVGKENFAFYFYNLNFLQTGKTLFGQLCGVFFPPCLFLFCFSLIFGLWFSRKHRKGRVFFCCL